MIPDSLVAAMDAAERRSYESARIAAADPAHAARKSRAATAARAASKRRRDLEESDADLQDMADGY